MNKKQVEFLMAKGINIEDLKKLRGSKESAHSKSLLEEKILSEDDLKSIENIKKSINTKLEGTNYSFGVYFHKK